MSNIQSRLSKDIEVTGTLKFQGELIFEGKFNGDLVQGSALVIAEGAEVRAKTIIVDNLTSAGLVDGAALSWARVPTLPIASTAGTASPSTQVTRFDMLRTSSCGRGTSPRSVSP